jgi:hypothetical protein
MRSSRQCASGTCAAVVEFRKSSMMGRNRSAFRRGRNGVMNGYSTIVL